LNEIAKQKKSMPTGTDTATAFTSVAVMVANIDDPSG